MASTSSPIKGPSASRKRGISASTEECASNLQLPALRMRLFQLLPVVQMDCLSLGVFKNSSVPCCEELLLFIWVVPGKPYALLFQWCRSAPFVWSWLGAGDLSSTSRGHVQRKQQQNLQIQNRCFGYSWRKATRSASKGIWLSWSAAACWR